ncbi:Uncharacterised protein [Salmonella enterica subsp. enterica serovar Bovismorbificans]|uniref:Uncharacterized protein n=1 Tax=Salmonella enterica subsp. enterica serovar Bovismorbificans TaxID=58097 RepID=A0A655DM00_SALET|nr:Uncharacterised protein [Salmonella enterica subsp. enterica serovar Bovismorbificans]CNV11455.1 Uncharacterised protein [Salmonella enterica subsp. enterica serovar Bovismorbificans]CPR44686.1 Uncharacterised protein [Salmonella enterica subsp. enterica serovar Bovismorbificans]
MDFDGVEVVAPFIRIVSGNAVAGDGVGQYHDTVAFRVQRQRDGRSTGACRPRNLLDLAKVIEIVFYRAALFGQQFTRLRVLKGADPR